MILAELEFYHSRAVAPTRRVALGDSDLPSDPPPGFGGILLGGVVAANVRHIDDDLLPDLEKLTHELEDGRRIPQPRLRFRYQTDQVGLLCSRAQLVRRDRRLELAFDDDRAMPAQRILAAVYAAGRLDRRVRTTVFRSIRRGMRWEGPIGQALLASLAGHHELSVLAMDDPVGWALETLGFEGGEPAPIDGLAVPERTEIQRRFRNLLRRAHPDHGGSTREAAERISELREARRILLSG